MKMKALSRLLYRHTSSVGPVPALLHVAVREVKDCQHCGGAGGRYVACHCQRCRG